MFSLQTYIYGITEPLIQEDGRVNPKLIGKNQMNNSVVQKHFLREPATPNDNVLSVKKSFCSQRQFSEHPLHLTAFFRVINILRPAC